MKGYICFTNIFIYKQVSCHEFIKKNLFLQQILIKLTINTDVFIFRLEEGIVVENQVIQPSVKLRQSIMKFFK
jgi:hypothetical protein